MYTHILAPTDGSDLAGLGVLHAAHLAKALGARLTFLTVTDPLASALHSGVLVAMGERTSVVRSDDARDPWGVASKILQDAANAAAAIGLSCETAHSVSDRPHDAIIKAAGSHGCDLIVMATHWGAGVAALLMGSETAHVLRHSPVPVLVVPPNCSPRAFPS